MESDTVIKKRNGQNSEKNDFAFKDKFIIEPIFSFIHLVDSLLCKLTKE
jgi:hypothetical protein